MTFQRGTARRIIALIRVAQARRAIVVGGYDPSLAPEAWTHPALGVDVIVRGEGELTFRELLRALDDKRPLDRESPDSGSATADGLQRNPPRPMTTVEDGEIAPPQSRARVLVRLHHAWAGRSTSSRPRAAARSTAASARSSRCAAATFIASRSSA